MAPSRWPRFVPPRRRRRSSRPIAGLRSRICRVPPRHSTRRWRNSRPKSETSFRGDAKHRTRNLEIPGLVLTHHPGMTESNCLFASLAMTAEGDEMTNIVLDIDNLVVGLGKIPQGTRIIDGVSLQVREGETLCLVGESGSGKSVTSLTVMGLLQKGSLVPSAGSVKLVGEELLAASDRRLRQLRATTMAMIFQEPMTALNPVVPVGRQIDEVLRVHTDLDGRARRKRILAMMEQVRLPEVERIFASYPHRLSGGQRQRIMIAMALVLEPKLLIADEPTTALDVTTQKQILTLIRDLQRDHGTAVLFITHDMGVVAEIADRVAVMRQGRLVETGALDTILRTPTMEYTRNLLSAVPSLVPRAPRAQSTEPVVLEANELGKVYRERSFFGASARWRRPRM